MTIFIAQIPLVQTEFERVSADEFAHLVRDITANDEFLRNNLTDFETYESFDCWVSPDRRSGYAVTPAFELVNVFSLCSMGSEVVNHATTRYTFLHLNCFSGYLENFYTAHGFEQYSRQMNWDPSGPDVVYMIRGNAPSADR
jgi:hypothetical protein